MVKPKDPRELTGAFFSGHCEEKRRWLAERFTAGMWCAKLAVVMVKLVEKARLVGLLYFR